MATPSAGQMRPYRHAQHRRSASRCPAASPIRYALHVVAPWARRWGRRRPAGLGRRLWPGPRRGLAGRPARPQARRARAGSSACRCGYGSLSSPRQSWCPDGFLGTGAVAVFGTGSASDGMTWGRVGRHPKVDLTGGIFAHRPRHQGATGIRDRHRATRSGPRRWPAPSRPGAPPRVGRADAAAGGPEAGGEQLVKARPARTSSSGTKNRPTRSISSSKAWPLAWAWAAQRCRRPGRKIPPT